MKTILGIIMLGLVLPILVSSISVSVYNSKKEFWSGFSVGLLMDLIIGLAIGGVLLLT